MSTLGRYHEYTGGFTMMSVGDIMSTLGGVQYTGGYMSTLGGIMSTPGVTMSTLEDTKMHVYTGGVQYTRGIL